MRYIRTLSLNVICCLTGSHCSSYSADITRSRDHVDLDHKFILNELLWSDGEIVLQIPVSAIDIECPPGQVDVQLLP